MGYRNTGTSIVDQENTEVPITNRFSGIDPTTDLSTFPLSAGVLLTVQSATPSDWSMTIDQADPASSNKPYLCQQI